MSEVAKFFAEVRDNIDGLRADASVRQATLDWVAAIAPHNYTYNFTWLGRPVIQFPQDLAALQEIIWDTRPSLIIETGIAHGGSLIFHASILQLLGNDDRVLGIEVDLYEWSLTRRWTQDGPLSWPMHESPYARQSASGEVSVGGATLTCDKGPIWLCACPGGKRYIAAYSGPEIASLRLEVPGDVVELAAIGAGIVVWDEGEVTVEAILS